eukprot:2777426-Rhodomonas_salina.4
MLLLFLSWQGDGWPDCGRRPYRQAHAQGRYRVPQVQGEEERVADCARCVHEPGRASLRRRKPSAYRQAVDGAGRQGARTQGWSHCGAQDRPAQGREGDAGAGREGQGEEVDARCAGKGAEQAGRRALRAELTCALALLHLLRLGLSRLGSLCLALSVSLCLSCRLALCRREAWATSLSLSFSLSLCCWCVRSRELSVHQRHHCICRSTADGCHAARDTDAGPERSVHVDSQAAARAAGFALFRWQRDGSGWSLIESAIRVYMTLVVQVSMLDLSSTAGHHDPLRGAPPVSRDA